MSDTPPKDSAKSVARKAAKSPVAPEVAPAQELPFEVALERLESIVEELENGEIRLADLIGRYEEATGLLKTCQQQLDAAQLRISKLSGKNGQIDVSPFDADTSAE